MSDRAMNFVWQSGLGFAALCLAAGLVLLWALRGVAPGRRLPVEADPESPTPGRRDRAALLGVLGVELIAAAAYVAAVVGIPWSIPLFGGGFFVLALVGRSNRAYRHASPSLRRIVRFADSALSASLLAGILVVGNIMAFRYAERPIDCTDEKVFSLESLTVNQLKTLSRKVAFTAFFGRGDRAIKQMERVQQLLDLYRAQNPEMIRLEVVALDADPQQTEELIRKFPDVATNPSGGGVAILYGEGESAAKLGRPQSSDLFELSRTGDPNRAEATFRGEDAITSALIQLREGDESPGSPSPPATARRSTIATGGPPESVAAQGPARRARDRGGRGRPEPKSRLPKGWPSVLLIGSRTPFSPGGDRPTFNLPGPRREDFWCCSMAGTKTGLEVWLQRCNIDFGPGVIVDPRSPRCAATPRSWPVPIGSQAARIPLTVTAGESDDPGRCGGADGGETLGQRRAFAPSRSWPTPPGSWSRVGPWQPGPADVRPENRSARPFDGGDRRERRSQGSR